MAGPGQGEASEVTATPRPGAQGKATNEKRVVRRYVVIARDLSRSSWAVASLTVALAALFALWPRSASPLVSNGLAELIRAKALKEGISNSSACGGGLARDSGAEALLMAGHFILYSQLEDGTFIESYKYRSPIAVGTNYGQIEQTQIEAIRALTSLYRYARTAASQFPRGFQTRLHEAVTLSFSLVEQHSRATGSGARYIVLPNAKFGRVATVANVLLAMVDLQRALSSGPMPKGVGLNAPTFAQTAQGWRLQRSIRAYTAFLLNMRLRNGRFVRTYETNGKPRKQHTAKMHVPKSEGAALLALAAVAKYADRPELWPLVKESAAALVRAYAPGDPLQSGGEKHAERDGLSFEAFATAKFLEGGAAQERPAPLHPHATSSPVPLANERESMITARHASSAGAIRVPAITGLTALASNN